MLCYQAKHRLSLTVEFIQKLLSVFVLYYKVVICNSANFNNAFYFIDACIYATINTS
jgi:hypothetical protein